MDLTKISSVALLTLLHEAFNELLYTWSSNLKKIQSVMITLKMNSVHTFLTKLKAYQ